MPFFLFFYTLPFLLAVAAALYLRPPKTLTLGWALAGIALAAVVATGLTRGIGFDLMGGNCQAPGTRAFMQGTQWAFMFSAAGFPAAAGLISGHLLQKTPAIGILMSLVLAAGSIVLAFGIVIGMGMAAVDSFRC
jgi:hypothetical protein